MYTTTLSNPKVQRLPGELFKSWVNVLCIARLSDGKIPPTDDVAFYLHCSTEHARQILDSLYKSKLLDLVGNDYFPHDWHDFQYASDGSAAARSRKSRAKKKKNATLQQRDDATLRHDSDDLSRHVHDATNRQTDRQSRKTEQNRAEQSGSGDLKDSQNSSSETRANALPLQFSEWPKTSTAICQRFKSTDSTVIGKIIQNSVRAFVSVDNPKFPELTDEILAEAIGIAAAESTDQKSAALFLKKAPTVVANMARLGRNGSSDPKKLTAADIDPSRIVPFGTFKPKEKA